MRKIKLLGVMLCVVMMSACTPEQAITFVFWDERKKAFDIAECESDMDPNTVSSTNDHGLFAINAPTWNKPGHSDEVADWIGRHWHLRFDPLVNATMAKKIRDKYGWRMWVCN